MKNFLKLFTVFAILLQFTLNAQVKTVLTEEKVKATILRLAELVDSNYVIEPKARELKDSLLLMLAEGKFNGITDSRDLAVKLNNVISQITKDKHFRFVDRPAPEGGEDYSPEFIEFMKQRNFGFVKTEVLPNNVGYMKFNGFAPVAYGGATAAAAMNFLANTKTIIFDLRENGGGEPEMIAYILSYLFEDSTLINTFYNRPENSYSESWTSQMVKGIKNTKAAVYVLTSSYSFSGAEEFAYDIQTQKKGLVVGEVTGGGAHPVQTYAINNLFSVRIPYMKAINPITKTNWEGIGIAPDINSAADDALIVAYTHCIEQRISASTDNAEKAQLRWDMEGFLAHQTPVVLSENELAKFVGSYGNRVISLENGHLISQRAGGPKFTLYPFTKDYFEITEMARLRFQFDENGEVESVELIFGEGSDGITKKNK